MVDVYKRPVYDKHTKAHNLRMPEIDNVTAWQRGELVFSNMYLEDIFTSLERKFPYAFVYSLHSLKKNTYSFRFPKQANLEAPKPLIDSGYIRAVRTDGAGIIP